MGSRLHILIVEDEPLVLEVLQATLEADYRVSSVATIGEARACLRTSHIDLVLVDWGLPDGRGETLAEFAEELGVPAVMMSGHPAGLQGSTGHSRPYLMKPFKVTELEAEIQSLLQSGIARLTDGPARALPAALQMRRSS